MVVGRLDFNWEARLLVGGEVISGNLGDKWEVRL